MKFIKVYLLLLVLSFNIYGNDKETISINFKDLKIMDFINITSRIINKNILITNEVKGKVDFISNKPLKKKNLLKLLSYVLESKGFTIVESQNILRIVKNNDTLKHNFTVVNNLSGSTKDIKIIELKNISASIAAKNLTNISKSLYPQKVENEKVVILANKDNNSVMIIGKTKKVAYLKRYIRNIDRKGSLVKRVVEVVRLKNVEASNVIKIIDSIIGKKKYIDENNKPFASIDEESNSVVIMGPSDEVGYIKDLISKLDVDKLQVYVKARIIEVNDSLVRDIGVKYGIFGARSNNDGLFTFSSSLNGGRTSFSSSSLSLEIPDLASSLALGASINLLKQNYAINVVSEPSILCINNKESSIYVGETVSIKTGETTNDTGSTNSYTREDVGLTLKVKPRISSGNKVTLEINTLIEGVKSISAASGNADTSKKEIKTTAIVNNGESVIIGGLIEDKQEETEDKIPLLGDVPLIGELFRNSRSTNFQKNLVVIITPYVIPKSKDLTYVRNQLSELSLLENKYLEDSLIRLKKKQIKERKEQSKRKEQDIKLDKKLYDMKYKYNDVHEKHLKIINGTN